MEIFDFLLSDGIPLWTTESGSEVSVVYIPWIVVILIVVSLISRLFKKKKSGHLEDDTDS